MATSEDNSKEKEGAMATSEDNSKEKEGTNLLGSPTFEKLENGRFKCVETGHELLAKDKDSYSQCKRCRLGLIDYAVSHCKPPVNMFKQDPLSRSKLICKLTGQTINKSEEHIWKHIRGKRFLNKLEEKEIQRLSSNGKMEDMDEQIPQKVSKRKKDKGKRKKEKLLEETISSEVRKSSDGECDAEEPEFWIPPVGERWDLDDGGDRWGSDSESELESDEIDGTDGAVENGSNDSEERSKRTKRKSIEIGPGSFVTRKKKSKKKKKHTC